MNYRYRVCRGLRKKGEPFDEYEGVELRSEDFDDDQEFCEAIAAHVYEILKDDKEVEDASSDFDDGILVAY